MKLAFCLFNYFPYGGLERNFLKISAECIARGHSLDIFTMWWEGENLNNTTVIPVPYKGRSNHTKVASYIENLPKYLDKRAYDLVMGFNRIPGIDLYYAADVCYAARRERRKPLFNKISPRDRILSEFERGVFSKDSKTEIILLSDKEKKTYQSFYGTPEKRFHLVPPGVNKGHIRSSLGKETREKVRTNLGLSGEDNFLLMIGSHFHTKGVDRSIKALASLPFYLREKARLFVIGKGVEKPYRLLANILGVGDKVKFLGTRDDVPLFLAGADFVLQPSRTENTGNPIVEAIVAGIPVMATESCGYAFHINRADSGVVIPDAPFSQKRMNGMLKEMLGSPEKEIWRKNAISYSDKTDLYNRFRVIAGLIEDIAEKNRSMAKKP
jgi:UDP-glucose:(heptosyl)LPS alpha-1,3-glucosyltransferase